MADSFAYERDGRLYPRVTRILDIIRNPGLETWRGRVGDAEADRVAQKAAKIGTAVHKAIQAVLAGRKPPKLTGERLRAFEAWQRWHEAQREFRPSRLETTLYGAPPFDWAGTPDAIEDGVVGGRNVIVDWKLTSAIEPKHWLQLHAYVPLAWPDLARQAWESQSPLPVTLRIVRIDPFLGLCEERERPFDMATLSVFVSLADVYRRLFFDPAIAAEQERLDLITADVAATNADTERE